MQSQIAALVANYFELAEVDLAAHHPVIAEVFRLGKGWLPCPARRRVSHIELVQLREAGVTGVQLAADGHAPDFSMDELVGRMSPLDTEMTDGVPVSEGSAVRCDGAGILAVLHARGVALGHAMSYLDDADARGEVVLAVSERDIFTNAQIEGWRYRLAGRRRLRAGRAGPRRAQGGLTM
jgi:hypothetical protein